MSYIVGVDEVGRGPLAGPVVIGIAWAPKETKLLELFPHLGDSKKVTKKRREEICQRALEEMRAGNLGFVTVASAAARIDAAGITRAIQSAVTRGFEKLPPECSGAHVYLDGRLVAPETFSQETVIGGDASVPIISLASIVAKVMRDRYMEKMGEVYPVYGFERHVGYGTKAHMEAVRAHGFCPLHRKTFCRNISAKASP